MTGVVSWQEWRRRRRGWVRYSPRLTLAERGRGRRRSPEEWKVLRDAAIAHVRRWEAEGTLMWLGPRHVRLNVGGPRGGASSHARARADASSRLSPPGSLG